MVQYFRSKVPIQKTLQLTARFLLVVLFLYAGTAKLIAGKTFIQEMMRSQLLPDAAVYLLRWLIPCAELLIGLVLLKESTVKLGMQASFFLMTSFTAYLIALVVIFIEPPCACGGILGGMSYPVHIAFNIFFTLVALVGIYTSESNSSHDALPTQQTA
jgi:uncharacterized membrane protein YphA (DoxX/SURF4 family)